MSTMTAPVKITCVPGCFICVVVDTDDITREDIAATDAQWEFIDSVKNAYPGSPTRLITASARENGVWVLVFAYRAIDGTICTDLAYRVTRLGEATFSRRGDYS